MAYFSNGNEAGKFENQCANCDYGEEHCPIQHVQVLYNYDACNNKVARKILDSLVDTKDGCVMFTRCFHKEA